MTETEMRGLLSRLCEWELVDIKRLAEIELLGRQRARQAVSGMHAPEADFPRESHDDCYRVLMIPMQSDVSPDGRRLHDDWLIADLGLADDNHYYYITTNRVRVSETPALGDIAEQAAVMVHALNEDARRNGRDRMSQVRLAVA